MKSGISPCLYTTGHFFGPPPSKNSQRNTKEFPKKSPSRPAIHGPRADRRADPDRSPSRSPSRSDWSTRSDRRRSPTSIRSPTSSRSDRRRNDIHADGMTYTPSRSRRADRAAWITNNATRNTDHGSKKCPFDTALDLRNKARAHLELTTQETRIEDHGSHTSSNVSREIDRGPRARQHSRSSSLDNPGKAIAQGTSSDRPGSSDRIPPGQLPLERDRPGHPRRALTRQKERAPKGPFLVA